MPANWARKVDETEDIDGGIHFVFGWGEQTIAIKELNLRETEEAIRFLEAR